MKFTNLATMLLLLVALAALTGCQDDGPTAPLSTDPAIAELAGEFDKTYESCAEVAQFSGFTIESLRWYNADANTTKFKYQIQGACQFQLYSFTLPLAECLPQPAHISDGECASYGENGITWTKTISGEGYEEYWIIFPGEIEFGEVIISGELSGEGGHQSDVSCGPVCDPVEYAVAATVFIDADEDGLLDIADELGIADVALELERQDGTFELLTTDEDGLVQALRTAGEYTLRVASPDSVGNEFFNDELAASFDATTALELTITVGPDSIFNVLGFSPRIEEIINEIQIGELPSDGRTARFWKRQIFWALLDCDFPWVTYDRETLQGFLENIRVRDIESVFNFTPGQELQEAFQILRARPRTEINRLLQQLLATQLNSEAGLGLSDQELQDVLIAWGEAIVFENEEGAARVPGGGNSLAPFKEQDVTTAADDRIPLAIDIFTAINTGGGGGVDE